ncbi:hypothetical protein JKF63_00924 [Porcisia hertigi]|uniref:Uncharacterized protein n=1 Tax=Porcisia hertigi TaxID=2761500 RepID=A0A836HQU5_9TRYP|nr:hypothetical protein JKF63_00924 [Porcisia hertigi]
MNITRLNYDLALPEFMRDLERCEFCAIDQEMTGVDVSGVSAPIGSPPEAVYHAKRAAVEAYNAFQIGIVFFTKSEDGTYEVRPYNFYLLKDTGDLRLDLSAISFLSENHMDFQTWLTLGLPYCNAEEEAAYTKICPTEMDDKELTTKTHFREQIDKWFSTDEAPLIKDLCCTMGFARRLQEDIRRKYDSHVIVNYTGNPSLAEKIRFTLTKRSTSEWVGEKEKNRVQDERVQAHRLGFRQFWKAVLQSGKPVVGHNFMQDLMFMIHMHETNLPSDYVEFKKILHRTLPIIYDTKTMATKLTGDSAFPVTHLEPLYRECRRRAGLSGDEFSTQFRLPLGFHSYNDRTVELQNKAHEAAYDAYMTGVAFSLMQKLYPDAFDEAKNVISAYGSAYFCCADTGDKLVNPNTFILETSLPRNLGEIEALFFATEEAAIQSAVRANMDAKLLPYEISGLVPAEGAKYSSYCVRMKHATKLEDLWGRLNSVKNDNLSVDTNIDLALLKCITLKKL